MWADRLILMNTFVFVNTLLFILFFFYFTIMVLHKHNNTVICMTEYTFFVIIVIGCGFFFLIFVHMFPYTYFIHTSIFPPMYDYYKLVITITAIDFSFTENMSNSPKIQVKL